MTLTDQINATELKMIERYIDSYAINDHRIASVQHILRVWDQAKSDYLYKMFDNQFILSKPIEFTRGVEEMATELENKIGRFGDNRRAYEFIEDFFAKVVRSIDFDMDYDTYYAVRGLVDYYCLAENVYHGRTVELPIPDSDKKIKIQDGCRITRVLGRIAKAYGIDSFEPFRIAHSMVLNQKALKGNMCISIHPLDYMTMSDNECDWTSCMSWQDNGCYRQGTVEMMNSPCVVVAYLRSADDMWMPGEGRWNSKKWRQLFIVTPEVITNVKAYPYMNQSLTDIVLDWLKELAEKADVGRYTQNIYEYSIHREFVIDEDGWDHHSLRINPMTRYMYNDFSDHQRCYVGIQCKDSNYFRFYYSGESECMACGSTDVDFSSEEQLVGDCCEEHYECDCCGESYYNYDDLINIDGMLLCECCVEDHCIDDALTGEIHYEDNMIEIYMGEPDNSGYHQDCSIYVYCDNLYDEYFAEHFSAIRLFKTKYGRTYYVNFDDCTEKGKRVFGVKSLEDLHEFSKDTWFYAFPTESVEKEAEDWHEIDYYWNLEPNTKIVKKFD